MIETNLTNKSTEKLSTWYEMLVVSDIKLECTCKKEKTKIEFQCWSSEDTERKETNEPTNKPKMSKTCLSFDGVDRQHSNRM